jgi:hypothetical protein
MELARELEAKTEIIRKLSVTNTELAEELSGAMEAARATGKENANLKRARTREARESAKAEQVERSSSTGRSTARRRKRRASLRAARTGRRSRRPWG